MAVSETARLIAALELDPRKFTKGLATADKAFGKFESRSFRAGQQIGTGIKNSLRLAAVGVGVVASQVALGVRSLEKLQLATSQTEAVIRSTGGAARVSAGGVRRLAEEFEKLNPLIGDEVIQAGENLLLTFTKIRGAAFKPTLRTILDMNTALGKGEGGLTNTVRVVGKALNDPIKGLTALGRVGVKFDVTQTKRIKQFVKEGQVAKAQAVILAELNKRFGGSFAKQGQTEAANFARAKDAVEDLQRTLAKRLFPIIGKVAGAFAQFLQSPRVIKAVDDLGAAIAGLFSDQNIATASQAFSDIFDTAKSAAPVITDAARATAGLVSGAVSLFRSLPPEIQKLAVGAFAINKLTGGLITNLGGGILDKLFSRGSPGNPMYVKDVTGGLGGGAAGLGGTSKLTKALAGLSILADVIAVIATQQQVSAENSAFAKTIAGTQQQFVKQNPQLSQIKTALDGVNQGINDIQANPLLVLVQGDALEQLRAMRTDLQSRLLSATQADERPGHNGQKVDTGLGPTLKNIDRNTRVRAQDAHILQHPSMAPTIRQPSFPGKLKDDIITAIRSTDFGGSVGKQLDDVQNATDNVRSTVGRGFADLQTVVSAGDSQLNSAVAANASSIVGQVSSTGAGIRGTVASSALAIPPPIVGAIRANRPIVTTNVRVSVTAANVTKSVAIQERIGTGNGSYGGGSHADDHG